MNINSTNKLFTLIVFSTFAVQHSLLFSIGCIIYFTLQNITQQELESIMNLRNYISNSDKWIKQLHEEAREIKVPLNTPRNIFTGLWEQLKDRFTPEQIESFQNNRPLTDKLVDVLEQETNNNLIQWDEMSIQDLIDDQRFETNTLILIQRYLPNYNLSDDFTYQDFRTVCKNIKVATRNPDGSIKNQSLNQDLEFFEIDLLRRFAIDSYDFCSMQLDEDKYDEYLNRDYS